MSSLIVVNAASAKLKENPNGKILIFSDFNGVLAPKVKNTELSKPQTKEIKRKLAKISKSDRIVFYVSSSKPASQLTDILGNVKTVGLSAEHGMQYRPPKSSAFINAYIDESTACTVLNKIPSIEGLELKPTKHLFSRTYNLVEKNGENNLEHLSVRINQSINKARNFEAVADTSSKQILVASTQRGKGNLVRRILNKDNFVFGISLGDKPADVGMHKVMVEKGFAGVVVGDKVNESDYHKLRNTDDVYKLFEKLVQLVDPDSTHD